MAEDVYHVKHLALMSPNTPTEVQIEEALNVNANWSYVDSIVVPGNAGVFLIFRKKE